MATIFSHVAIPLALAAGFGLKKINRRLTVLGMLCAIAPDFDVLGFKFGIAYASPWGHRGFTHSLFFACVCALLLTLFHRGLRAKRITIFAVAFVSMASHLTLDAMTTGGLGVAALWPFDLTRYFLPWRPIAVSPIGVGFFSERGLTVLYSEALWVWLPAVLAVFVFRWWRRRLN